MGNVTSYKESLRLKMDNINTQTAHMQRDTENECLKYYKPTSDMSAASVQQLKDMRLINAETSEPRLLRHKTVAYLEKSLHGLSGGYASLDASRPWLIYWMTHALELLDSPYYAMHANCINTLSRCQHPDGGFGGGMQQFPHTAPTYAACLALVDIGTPEALACVDRCKLYSFLWRVKDSSGGFRVQEDGEMDTRGLYTALAVASLFDILTPELTNGCADYVGQCQGFDGGIGGEPGNEPHGGYSFCGLAALVILEEYDTIDIDAFLHWVVNRQLALEGGFQGRTNKLVDSCYSFWQGAAVPLAQRILAAKCGGGDAAVDAEGLLLFDQVRLQQYILLCCQHVEGGLRDKPPKQRDHYHTCYALSGLSTAQHHGGLKRKDGSNPAPLAWGDQHNNVLVATDPVFNVSERALKNVRRHFAEQPDIPRTHEALLQGAKH